MANGGSGDRPKLVSVGGAMVDRYYRVSNLPAPDGGAFARESWREFGGAAANVACATERLGRDAGLVTRLGTDRDGDGYDGANAVLADLRERGVDAERVRRGPETGSYSLVLAGPDGGRMVVTGGESATNLALRDADWPHLRAADVVVTNAYAPDDVVSDLVAARRDGRLSGLALDLSGPLPELEGRGTTPETLEAVASAADLFVAGRVAAESFCRYHDRPATLEGARSLLADLGATRVALTRGADGATLTWPGGTREVAAIPVETVDTTGAGDAFFAGLVDAWLLEERSTADAGRFAAAVAALNCTAEGARGGLPTRRAVHELLERRS